MNVAKVGGHSMQGESLAAVGDSSARSITWSPALSRRRKHRVLLLSLELLGTVLVASFSVVIAYLMHNSWPRSVHTPSDAPFSTLSTLWGVLLTLQSVEFRPYVPLFVFAGAVLPLVLSWLNLYRHKVAEIRPFADSGTIFRGAVAATVAVSVAGMLYGRVDPRISESFSVFFCVYYGVLLIFGILLLHSGLLNCVLALRSSGIGWVRAAVVVSDDGGERLIQSLSSPQSPFEFAGLVTVAQDSRTKDESPRVLGDISELSTIINEEYLDELILAIDPNSLSSEDRLGIAQTCWKLGTDLKMVTPFHPYFHTSHRAEIVGDVPLLQVERVGLYSSYAQLLKWMMDYCLSITMIVVCAPLMLAVAILIKLDSRGPVFFSQERAGLNSRVFRMIKFRSMVADTDPGPHREAQRELIANGKPAEVDMDGNPIYGKVAHDVRVTRVGNFIRRWSIDELPQLFNVVRGEMSIVGPRPSVACDVEQYRGRHIERLNIRPGITGLWQVSGRSRLSFEEMVELDIQYIEDWSLLLDAKILLKTIPAVLKTDEAF